MDSLKERFFLQNCKNLEAEIFAFYTYRVFQPIQMKLILLCVWAERAVLGSAKTALKLKYMTFK